MKIFISSEMRSGALGRARAAVADAIEKTGIAEPWWWEKSAHAGPYSAAKICLVHARKSDGLVLILADQLTPMTRKEYLAARREGIPRYIMTKNSAKQSSGVDRFVRREQKECVTEPFRTLSELKTRVVAAISQYAATAVRLQISHAQQRSKQSRKDGKQRSSARQRRSQPRRKSV